MNGLWGLCFEVDCFFFCLKTSWSQINMSILYSEYESPNYSSLHLGKMCVFGPCGIFKADMKKNDSGYMVCNFANENEELLPMLCRDLESFH